MRRALALLVACAALLTVCSEYRTVERSSDRAALTDHDVADPENDELRAGQGNGAEVISLQTGENVSAVLPAPFVLYPGAHVLSTTRVERGKGRYVKVDFTTGDGRATLLGFYRQQGRRAGMAPQVEVASDTITTIGGRSADGHSHFSLRATDAGDLTEASLTVVTGFE